MTLIRFIWSRPWLAFFVIVGLVTLAGSLVTSTATGGLDAVLAYALFLLLVYLYGI